jgi:hypothetical protein
MLPGSADRVERGHFFVPEPLDMSHVTLHTGYMTTTLTFQEAADRWNAARTARMNVEDYTEAAHNADATVRDAYRIMMEILDAEQTAAQAVDHEAGQI